MAFDLANRLIRVGVPYPLAAELVAQITSGTANPLRLIALGVPYPLASEIGSQIEDGVGNAVRLMSLGMSGEAAKELESGITPVGPRLTLELSGDLTPGSTITLTSNVTGATDPVTALTSASLTVGGANVTLSGAGLIRTGTIPSGAATGAAISAMASAAADGTTISGSAAAVVAEAPGPIITPLHLPHNFSVTLYRDETGYHVQETIDTYRAAFSGPGIYVSPTGNDSTGTGTVGSPLATIGAAVTAAVDGGTIYLAAGGKYAPPAAALAKSLRFAVYGAGGDGKAYVGEFVDTSGWVFNAASQSGQRYYTVNVDTYNGGNYLDGYLLIGNHGFVNLKRGFYGRTEIANAVPFATQGYACAFQSTSTKNFSLITGGTNDATTTGLMAGANAAGNLLAWNQTARGIEISGAGKTLLIDDNVVVCAATKAVKSASGTAALILGACEVYASIDTTVETACPAKMFGARAGGATNNVIDYLGSTANLSVEVGCRMFGGQNATTSHGAITMRVDGEYGPGIAGSRIVSDLASHMYLWSCRVHQDVAVAAYSHVRFGDAGTTNGTQLAYGDCTFTVANGGSVTEEVDNNAVNAPIIVGLADPWPWAA